MVADCRTGTVLTLTFRAVEETGSTNADLLALASAGAGEGYWLRADRQTAGRGRQGREWASPPGNLYASTLVRLRPTDPPAPTLAFVAAVALHDAVRRFLATPLMLKWPNDLLVDGAKLSGILLERAGDAVVIGFGVNLAYHPADLGRATTSLLTLGVAVAPDPFMEALGQSMEYWLARWRAGGMVDLREDWLARAHPEGSVLSAHLPDGMKHEGQFVTITGDGALVLRLADGESRVIHAADVFLI